MSTSPTNYIPTIGLEIHVQLDQKRKMFAPEAVTYGEPPNTHTSPTTLAHPGTLPIPNQGAIYAAIRMGLACHAQITPYNVFARKNYYHPDLTKGFQITQDQTPICRNGYITLYNPAGEKQIPLQRIHIEEDTGKSIHPPSSPLSLLNYDRAGIPLIEIVTKPVLTSAEEVEQSLLAVRRLVRYLEISKGHMEEGSLRCDVNISIRPKDQTQLGTKVEIKNLNSRVQAGLATLYEIERQSHLLSCGKSVEATTRSYDPIQHKTLHQRKKEGKTEYRYFEEPNISPILIHQATLKKLQANLPTLPHQLYKKLTTTYALPPAEALVITETKAIAQLFQSTCQESHHYKIIANLIIGPLKSYLNQEKTTLHHLHLTPIKLAQLAQLIAQDRISFTIAATHIFPLLLTQAQSNPHTIAQDKGLLQVSDHQAIKTWVESVIQQHPTQVAAYQAGKKGLLGFFMREVMQISQRQANPKQATTLLREKLNQKR